jgi:Tol biopolymer transport system component
MSGKSATSVALLLLSLTLGLRAQGGTLELASVSLHGKPCNSSVDFPTISGNGRYVIFQTDASDLVPGDTNGFIDLFLRDLHTQQTECISVDPNGRPIGGGEGRISRDGRYVLFSSGASGFGPVVPARTGQIYLRDRLTGKVELISQSTSGTPGNSTSLLSMYSYVMDPQARYVAFRSYATNLVPLDTNGSVDVFLRDRVRGTTIRISEVVPGIGGISKSQWITMSEDGAWLIFATQAFDIAPPDYNGNGDDVILYDVHNGTLSRPLNRLPAVQAGARSLPVGIEPGGKRIYLRTHAQLTPQDTNGQSDIYAFDLTTNAVERISTDPNGQELPKGISWIWYSSRNGRILYTTAPGAVSSGVYLWDYRTSKVTSVGMTWPLPSPGGMVGMVSADGTRVAYMGYNLLPGENGNNTSAYVRHLYPECSALDPIIPGRGTRFRLFDPDGANKLYVAVMSMSFTPAIPIGGARYLYAAPDILFLSSLSAPNVFFNFIGTLDSQGTAQALFIAPAVPSLRGLPTVTAFLVFDPKAHNGVSGISNSVPLVIQ